MDAMTARVPAHVPQERVTDINIYHPAPDGGDPTPVWQAFQRQARPIMWTTTNGGHWIGTRGGVIRTILSDHEHFSSQVLMVPREQGLSNLLPTAADPPRHRPFRALINTALSPAAIRLLEPEIRGYARELISGFADRGHADYIADFAAFLPTGVFLRLADLPISDHAMLNDWMDRIMRPEAVTEADESQGDLMDRFADYLRPILDKRRHNPGKDILSAIAAGMVEGRPITEEEAISMGTTLILGGLDTVVALMSFAMNYLARDPKLQELLTTQPERMNAAVEEFCRRFPVGTNTRIVCADVELDGVMLKAGDCITAPQILHALDEGEFPDAERFDIDRVTGGYSTFGHGVHRCPGSFLGKTELKVVLEEWLAQIPRFHIARGVEIKVNTGISSGIFSLPLEWPVAPHAD